MKSIIYQTLGTSMDGYVSFVPGSSFIFVTNTLRLKTPTQSSRLTIVGSLQRASLLTQIFNIENIL